MIDLKYIGLFLFAAVAFAQPSGTFQLIAKYRGIGGLVATAVAPGPKPGSERLYASYLYTDDTLEVLSIDPETGNTETFHNPIRGEFGAWGITAGPSGAVFLGTMPNAHFLKLDTKQGTLTDLGRPSLTEQYIWDLASGSDARLYGVTYPNCKLVRYDPATGRLEDLGRLDPTEQYARSIVSSNDGFLYVGIGTSKANIAAYNIRTGQHRELLSPTDRSAGIAKVYRGSDGKVYGAIGTRTFRLNQWTATALESGHAAPAAIGNTLRDGRTLSLSDNQGTIRLEVTNPKTHATTAHQIPYQGQQLSLFRIGLGPDGVLYGSTVQPIHLVDADITGHRLEEIGNLGAGEVYSFLSHGQQLLMGAYSGLSTLMSYRPGAPFHPAAKSGNPVLMPLQGDNPSWRPMAMIDGHDGNVYVGVAAGYGQLEAPLITWSPETGSIQRSDEIVRDQSIVSLATWHDLIIGGTMVGGVGGSHPTQTDAKLFIWNPKTHQKEFEVIPVARAPSITDLITAPNDTVYGIAGDTLFEFNPGTRKIVSRQKLPFSKAIYNSVSVDESGRIWGLAEDGIFMVDARKDKVELIARPPFKITGGFAMRNGKVYFTSGSAVYSYMM